MKLYDFDGMFNEKLSAYISKNPQKFKEEEWEDVIPKLYNKFGDTVIKSLGKTPRGYYAEMSDEELISCLKQHIKTQAAVPEFLCDEIDRRSLVEKLLPMLDGTAAERKYAMNLIGADARAIKKYMQILLSSDDEDVKNQCADFIKEKADLVLEEALENYKKSVETEYMCEILSNSVVKDDRILETLLKEFRCDVDNIPLHASYLAAYGDERALPYLLNKIDEEGISYIDFRELKFAIEALGGEYLKERDFSSDPYFKLIKEETLEGTDIFESFWNSKKQ